MGPIAGCGPAITARDAVNLLGKQRIDSQKLCNPAYRLLAAARDDLMSLGTPFRYATDNRYL
jgi:hypothetical protein